MDRLTRMFAKQLELQQRYGADPTQMTGDRRIACIKEDVLACTDELHEALGEIGWKSWATGRHVNEDEAFGELRDAWQFLTNLMFAVKQVSPAELAELLERSLDEKLKINHARHTEGYDGVSTKCPGCTRALEEVSILELPCVTLHGVSSTRYVCVCGVELPRELALRFVSG